MQNFLGAHIFLEREKEREEKKILRLIVIIILDMKGNRREWWTLIFDKNNKKIIEKLQYYNTERVCKRESECVEELFTFSGKKIPMMHTLSRVKLNYFQSNLQSEGVFICNNFCVCFDKNFECK